MDKRGNEEDGINMNIKSSALLNYNKAKHLNSDPYGKMIFNYAEQWADSMEEDLELLGTDKDIVEYLKENYTQKSMETPLVKDGLTGNQHDIANVLLITCWKYGEHIYIAEALEKQEKRWHINDTQQKHLEHYLKTGEVHYEEEKENE